MKNVFALCMMTVIVSLLGFIVENVWLAVTCGYMNNRNMVLPFLFGYGLAVTAIYLIFGTPREMRLFSYEIPFENQTAGMVTYFCVVMLGISLGEMLLGMTVERLCGIVWWDYTHLPLHITRYTSVPTSLGFTVMIFHFMDNTFVSLYNFFLSWKYELLAVTAIIFTVMLSIDFIRSGYLMYRNRTLLKLWQIETKKNKLYRLLHR